MTEIISRLREYAAKNKISKSDLAKKCGVSRSALYAWFDGSRNITEDALSSISARLGVSVEWLKGEPEKLSVAQGQLALLTSESIAELQEYLQKALTDPAWAEEEWQRVLQRGRRLQLSDTESEHPGEEFEADMIKFGMGHASRATSERYVVGSDRRKLDKAEKVRDAVRATLVPLISPVLDKRSTQESANVRKDTVAKKAKKSPKRQGKAKKKPRKKRGGK